MISQVGGIVQIAPMSAKERGVSGLGAEGGRETEERDGPREIE